MTHEKQPLATEALPVAATSLAAEPENVRGVLWPEYHVGSGEGMQAHNAYVRAPTPADCRGWGINE